MSGTPGFCGSLTHAELAAMARRGATYAEMSAAAGVARGAINCALRRLGLTGPRGGDRCSPGWLERRAARLPPPRTT